MIIIDEDSSTSERSPLKSPSSPVTARYDSPNGTNTQQPTPPPYFPQGSPGSGPSSPHHLHHPHHPHPHPHSHSHGIAHPYSPHAETHSHPQNELTHEEYKVIRHRTRHRFFGAFFVAWLIVVVWTWIVRGITVVLIIPERTATDTEIWCTMGEAGDVSHERPSHWLPAIRWPHPYSSPAVIPCPTATVADTPDNTAPERILSIAYPPRAQITPS